MVAFTGTEESVFFIILVILRKPFNFFFKLQSKSFFHDYDSKGLPNIKTATPMKTARKIRPGASATYSIRNANDPAKRVPNPLFSPLDNVAPAIRGKTKMMKKTDSSVPIESMI